MAGKSNKGRNKGRAFSSNSKGSSVPIKKQNDLSFPLNTDNSAPESFGQDANGVSDASGNHHELVATVDHTMGNSNTTTTEASKQAEGELHLYAVPVKGISNEKLELQLSPTDSVMDIRQFLLDAPETCYITCYDLALHTKDGSSHHLEDYSEISEVADITAGGCSLEMVAALYDDRSIRSHVRRVRDLLSLSTLHASLSTALALQHENSKQKISDAKVEGVELDGLGFMEDISSSLVKLLMPSPKEIKCVESIVFSSFNPPPSYRRLVGDLMYLDVVTLEANMYCITGTTTGFYVNSSNGSVLDPRPAKPAYEANTLFGLLQKLSVKFRKGFREILEQKASAHPFENVQLLLPPNSWLTVHPLAEHKRDAARAENAVTLTYGTELMGMQRDWNEELQSCREFPHKSQQERILRDRALYKVSCDFVDAAINGAIGVINRCIPPINPTDPECFHMYVHNNIFFSFAVDSDLGLLSKEASVLKPSAHFGSTEQRNTNSPTDTEPEVDSCSGSSTSNSSTSSAQDGPEIRSGSSTGAAATDVEQATYASANNDLKGTKAYQEVDIAGLYTLAMAIIDYRGFRVVAQSIIPGILQGDKSESLLYGSVDNGKKICWNESFHSKVVEAAKRLHLKEHTVLDASGNPIKLAAPVECKGIVGSDDRHYLLDLMRVTPRDANYTGSGSRFCVLRPELVASFCQTEATQKLASASEYEGKRDDISHTADNDDALDTQVGGGNGNGLVESSSSADDPVPSSSADDPVQSSSADGPVQSEDVLLNPNVFTEFKLAGNQEVIAADEGLVKKAASYLVDIVLPKFVQDLCSLEVSPMDGQTLTDSLHAHGINVRYLGKVASMTKHVSHLWDVCVSEIIIRSTKHLLKDVIRDAQDHDIGPAIAHFLNCFIGQISSSGMKSGVNSVQSGTPKKGQLKSATSLSRKKNSSHLLLTSEKLWSSIQDLAKLKYQIELPDDARLRVRKVSAIRNLCQKVGITIAARKFDLGTAAPFQIADILNLQPVVKHSVPVCVEVRELMDKGKAKLAEGLLNEAYNLFSEAFSILQQVTGPMHREVANCCRYLAMVLYHAGDMAGAIMQQHKELIINERCLGLDHPDTAHSYGNMALFYHGLNQTELALRHMSRTLLLLSLSSGPDHPDVAATFINVAMMYQDIGKMDTALRYLQEALKKNERLLGPDHIQTAVCYHALAIAFNCMGAYKLSLQHEKKTYDILLKQLGEDDSRTRDSDSWIKTFKLREQQANAQKQKGQVANSASAQKAIDILKAHPDLVQAFQTAARGSGNFNTSSVNRSMMLGEGLPRGRGVDERAARAAAEARKKAAARGLLVRPNSVPIQALPQLTQLLNIINNSEGAVASEVATGDSQPNESYTDLNKDSAALDLNATGSENHEDKAPVGLGTGLASLDSKKQKSKPKV